MVITILPTDLLLKHIGEKSEAISRDVRKSAYSELPLSRRVLIHLNIEHDSEVCFLIWSQIGAILIH